MLPGTIVPVRVLVIDDDPGIRRSLTRAFTLEGMQVEAADDGLSGLEKYVNTAVDLIVLDVTMAGFDGLAFCHTLRAAGDPTPILMLTARDSVEDRVTGLDAGADDYLSKPFALTELFARVRALTRRVPAQTGLQSAGGITLDAPSRVARRGERTILLTAIETSMLAVLLENHGHPVSRDSLADALWGPGQRPRSNTIDVYVKYLRTKLEAGEDGRVIHTVRGIGYCLAIE